MEGAIRWFSRNHVAANFLMLAVMLAGFTTWFKLRKEIFPETSIDTIAITVPYPNATPEEVERGVAIPIEEAVSDVNGIKNLNSNSMQNVGNVMIDVETGYKLRDVMDDVKTRIDAIDNFPEEAESPVLEEILIKTPVMSVAVVADTDETTLRRIAEDIRDGLLTYEPPPAANPIELLGRMMRGTQTISQVELTGTRPYEISIEVPEQRLRELGLTLAQVADAIRRTSVDLPGGSIRTSGGEVILRALGKKYRAADLANVPVTSKPDGSVVRLGDIADLVDGFEDIDLRSSYDGTDAVIVNVFRTGEEDTTLLANMVEDFVARENQQLPDGVRLEIWNDQSVYLKGRMDLLARNATFGLLLVLLVLTLFLRPSLALLVGLGIPASFAGGIWMMPTLGISINMISLFAFILVLGIVVDDAIVTGENVYYRIQQGEHPSVASWKGTHEVGTVVIFGVLTTIVAFVPMLMLSGVSGKIWPNIPLVVIPTLLFSLLQSKFVLPAHLSLLHPSNREKKVGPILRLQRKVADGLEWFITHFYRPAVHHGAKWRYILVAVFGAILILSLAMVATGRIKFIFFPKVEGDLLTAKVELAQGVPFEETQNAVQRIADAMAEIGHEFHADDGRPVVEHMLASSGTQPFKTGFQVGGAANATHVGEVTVELVPAAERAIGSEQLVEEWRKRVGEIPGIVELRIQAETAAGGNAIDVKLAGPDLNQLLAATEYAKAGLAEFAGVIDISDSNRAGKEEVRFIRLTPAGEALGFRLGDIATQVRDAFYGNEVQRLQRGRDELKVMVRYPKADRRTLRSLEDMKVRTPAGDAVPIQQVVEYEYDRGPSTITRNERSRSVRITADVDSKTNANEVVARFTDEILANIGTKFPGVRYAFEGEQKDQADSTRELGVGFLGALVIMYVLIAIPLRSYVQPLIIMSVIPFGLVGAIWGHGLLGFNLSIMSMCGLVALAGVVVNDSLVMVDFVNRHRTEAPNLLEAIENAGARRFRAIILTSLTTFVGLVPMLLEQDMQAKFLIPMAVSLAFGILFATLITLFLVPSVYMILDDVQRIGARILGIRRIDR
ncbi:MAG: efflux RND transporter permease subunit [Verrucomicrobiota bacterium JB025]|nr:efflux RND transporter permease subunit [Verrucomicrobiota bacterium JB025]